MKKYTVEICCGSISDCLIANKYDIQRIELNCALELGGLTPSVNLLKNAKEKTNKKIVCMVRNRTAGFNYNDDEKEIMFLDARLLLENGADGIVFGFLNSDRTIDIKSTLKMVDLVHSYNKEAIFHRAFDYVLNPYSELEKLIDLKVNRVLTSGLEKNALLGANLIGELNKKYGSKIELLPGCGINASNILEILDKTKANQFHMTAKTSYTDIEEYYGTSQKNIEDVLKVIQQ